MTKKIGTEEQYQQYLKESEEGEYERGRKDERERISAVCFKMERERRGQLPVELWQALKEGIK